MAIDASRNSEKPTSVKLSGCDEHGDSTAAISFLVDTKAVESPSEAQIESKREMRDGIVGAGEFILRCDDEKHGMAWGHGVGIPVMGYCMGRRRTRRRPTERLGFAGQG